MDNLRRFLFTLSAVVFLALCIGGYMTALKYDPKEIQQEPGNPTPLPPAGNLYDPLRYELQDYYDGNVLYILAPSQKREAVNFLVSKYSPVTQELSFLLIPENLKTVDHETGNKVISLGKYFSQYGAERTAKYLTSLLGIDIPCYTTFTYDSLSDFISGINSIKCELPYPIKFIDTETSDINYSTGINYPQGSSTISGSSAINLIRFIGDTGAYLSSDIVEYYDDADPLEIHASMSDDIVYFLLSGFVNHRITADNQENFNEFFAPFLESYDTNMTEETLEGMCYNLGKTDPSQVKYYLVTGNFQSNREFYLIYNNMLTDLKTGKDITGSQVLDYLF